MATLGSITATITITDDNEVHLTYGEPVFESTYWTHELHWQQQRIDRHMTRCAAHRERRRRRGR